MQEQEPKYTYEEVTAFTILALFEFINATENKKNAFTQNGCNYGNART